MISFHLYFFPMHAILCLCVCVFEFVCQLKYAGNINMNNVFLKVFANISVSLQYYHYIATGSQHLYKFPSSKG